MDGNFTPSMSQEECFASVVSTEAVCLGFVLAQIQGLQCIAGDVCNAFLTAFTHKKIYIQAGPEFGNLEGRIMVMKKAVYGTKTAALCFHMNHFLYAFYALAFGCLKQNLIFGIVRQSMAMNILQDTLTMS